MRVLNVGVGVLFLVSSALAAQESSPSTATPASTATHTTASALLTRTVKLDIEHRPLREALATLADQAGLRLVYDWQQVPVTKVVSLVADKITVSEALHLLLQDTGVEPVVLASGQLRLRPAGESAKSLSVTQQGTAVLSGAVHDSGTGTVIPQVTVHIDGASLSVKSGSDGQFKISGIAAGEYRVTARRVGYLAKTRTVTLADGDSKKLDFDLNPPATQLNEVVTTALGEQRRYQVGNVVSTINVDSIAPDAPVTSVTDLLEARVPGLEVVQSSGLAGAGPAIRIRGQSSLLLQTDPIIIVDGIRVDNTPGNIACPSPTGVCPSPSRINDLDFNEIESISVLKGPTATTEYGSDAANGVIVITTKRGHAGTPVWTASLTQGATEMPFNFANYYWDWGHSTDGLAAATWNYANGGHPCNLGYEYYDEVDVLTGGECVVDSISMFNPLDHAATTEYGSGPTSDYDLSVSGGNEQIQYRLGGGIENQEGLVHVPDVLQSEANALGYSNSALRPNSLNQGRVQASGSVQITRTLHLQLNGVYMSTYQETPGQVFLVPGGQFAPTPVLDDSANLFGYGQNDPYSSEIDQNYNPLANLGQISSQQTERWTGAASAAWQPIGWLGANLTVGVDHEAQTSLYQETAQSQVVATSYTDSAGGSINDTQERNDNYYVSLAANATVTFSRYIRLQTTAGAQYNQSTSAGVTASASDLPASAFSLNNAPRIGVGQNASSLATGGVYAETQLQVGERCFMPLALRIDAGSAFGNNVSSEQYPKWDLSCLVLTGATTVRLYGAYGAAGQQPPPGDSISNFFPVPVAFGNAPTGTGYSFNAPGNPNLKPETGEGWEYGVDIGTRDGRFSLSADGYSQYRHNALWNTGLGISLYGAIYENIGDVRNIGQEMTMTLIPMERRTITAALTITGSVNHNTLLRLAPDILSDRIGGAEWFKPGYPLFSYFGDSIQYADENHDGILEDDEFQYNPNDNFDAPPDLYMGSSLPTKTLSVAPSVSLLPHRIVQVSALLQYEGGNKIYNADPISGYSGAVSSLGAPLWLQAYNQAQSGNKPFGAATDSFLSGDYLAWNECSAAVALPPVLARAMRLHAVHVVFLVQDLALWTGYPFGDPRVSDGATTIYNQATNTTAVNNDIRSTGANVVPLPRLWSIRLNLGL